MKTKEFCKLDLKKFQHFDVNKRDTFKIHPRSKSTRVQNPPDQNPPGQTREPLTGRG